MKYKKFLTLLFIRILAIAFIALGLWFFSPFIMWSFGGLIFLILVFFGIFFFLTTGIHLFRLDDIGRKILIGTLCVFNIPFFIFIIAIIIDLITPPFGQISIWGIDIFTKPFPKIYFINILIYSIPTIISLMTTIFLCHPKTKALFEKESAQTEISVTKHMLILIYKILQGSLIGFIAFLGLSYIKIGIGYYFSFESIFGYEIFPDYFFESFFPIQYSGVLGVNSAYLIEGDLLLVAALLGGGIAFLINFRKILYDNYSGEAATKTFRWVVLCLFIIWTLSIFSAVNTRVKIRAVYSEFCEILRTEDTDTAAEYISPIFREAHPKGKGVNRAREFSQYCSEEKGKTLYVSTFGKSASIFPEDSFITLIDDYYGHTVIPMEKVDGRWYLTGRGAWRFEWFFD